MKTIHLQSMQIVMNIMIFRSQCRSAQVEEVVEAISEAVSSRVGHAVADPCGSCG